MIRRGLSSKRLSYLLKNFTDSFEEKGSISKTFGAIFESLPLSDKESSQIHSMLEGSVRDGVVSGGEINDDHQALTEITTQIRAITRQSIVLHGERIHKAQIILKKYRDGTFSKWLQLAYGSRQTPYNMLQFYDLFVRLEKGDKELMQSMPKRAAYALASRSGEVEEKVKIISNSSDTPFAL